ncbi:MAG: hypothetical protein CMH66_13160, partial [Nioella sp.]|nr:hypothetical protein [Nioella sp.]
VASIFSVLASSVAAQDTPAEWAVHRIYADYNFCREIIMNANPIIGPHAIAGLAADAANGAVRLDVTLHSATQGGSGLAEYRFHNGEGLLMRCSFFAPLAPATANEVRALMEDGYGDPIAAPNFMPHDESAGSRRVFPCIDPDQPGAPQTNIHAEIFEDVNQDGVPGYRIFFSVFFDDVPLACSERLQ